MDKWFGDIWNSASSLGRYFALFSALTLAFSLLSPVCGVVLYKISQRRDYLKDVAEQKAEHLRKLQVLKLDEQITNASLIAQESVQDLTQAQAQLSETRVQLAAATHEAALRLNEYLASKQKLESLSRQSQRIVSVRLRFEARVKMAADPVGSRNTHTGLNVIAWLFTADQSKPPIPFTGSQAEASFGGPDLVTFVGTLAPQYPSQLSGADIDILDDRTIVGSNIHFFFSGVSQNPVSNASIKWVLLVNGAAFPLTDFQPAEGRPLFTNVTAYDIVPAMRHISDAYRRLVE